MDNILTISIGLYLLASIVIGLYAARKVKTSKDYVLAGRHLPLYIITATVFATWFGAESILWTSSTFVSDGLAGMVGDPFAASLALVLVWLFFAKKLYEQNLLTIGDFYKNRYGRAVEILSTISLIGLYLAWTSAQVTALGLAFHIVLPGISITEGVFLGSWVVLLYTVFGGMWSVALTDFMQMIIILIGLFVVAWIMSDQAGWVAPVLSKAVSEGKFEFFPDWNLAAVLAFIGPWIALAFGSIPQQDIFQRVMSAKSEKIAAKGSIYGGIGYFIFAFIPAYIAFSGTIVDPELVNAALETDGQLILPNLIMAHTPVIVQAFFFGALLSAIMSTASGAILAPATILTENIVKPMMRHLSDKHFLWINRGAVFVMTGVALAIALNSEASITKLVEIAGRVTAATIFVPLVLGLYWKKASNVWALLSILLGWASWLTLEMVAPEGVYPPVVVGFVVSLVMMVVGSLTEWAIRKSQRKDNIKASVETQTAKKAASKMSPKTPTKKPASKKVETKEPAKTATKKPKKKAPAKKKVAKKTS